MHTVFRVLYFADKKVSSRSCHLTWWRLRQRGWEHRGNTVVNTIVNAVANSVANAVASTVVKVVANAVANAVSFFSQIFDRATRMMINERYWIFIRHRAADQTRMCGRLRRPCILHRERRSGEKNTEINSRQFHPRPSRWSTGPCFTAPRGPALVKLYTLSYVCHNQWIMIFDR